VGPSRAAGPPAADGDARERAAPVIPERASARPPERPAARDDDAVWLPPRAAAPAAAAPVAAAAPSRPAGRGLSVPSTPPEMLHTWESVLEAFDRKPSLSVFKHARILAWTAEAIDLGFATEFHSLGEMAGEKTKLDEARAMLIDLHGAAPALRVKLLDESESSAGASRSVVEADRERAQTERKKREAEAREHPLTKHVLATFGAQIKEIKTDV
jgi:hypothetical protein